MIYLAFLLAGGLASESVSATSSSFGDCICDLTSGSCDLYCCCDSDCGGLVDDWSDQCVGEELIKSSTKCFKESSDSLEAGWRGMKVATNVINKLFCVFRDNSPSGSNNFEDVESGSTARQYNTEVGSMVKGLSLNTKGAYGPGDFVSAEQSGYSYPWSLPRPDAYGLCGNTQPTQWLVNTEQSSCSLYLNVSDECSKLSIAKFTSSLSIDGKTPKVSRIFKRASDINVLQPSTSLSTSVSGCTCKNAVVQANYTVFTVDQRTVDSVQVELVVEDLSSCENEYYDQVYSVRFLTNNSEVFIRSGNPGYQIGKFVIAGFIESEKEISYYENGFQVPGISSNGLCSSKTWYLSPYITFGEDLVVNCYLEMDFEELKSLCSAENYKKPSLFFDESLVTMFGKFGNINASYEDDWVFIKNATTSTPSFDEASGVCSVQTILAYYIVYSGIGNVRNPQNKIIYASREYKDQTFWQFRNWDKTQKQKFFYTLTFSFIEYEKSEFNYFPPAPNPLPIMPDDILYPFKISIGQGLGATFLLFFVNF